MTDEETAGGVGEPHWFVAYSRALQWVGEVEMGMAHEGGSGGQSLPAHGGAHGTGRQSWRGWRDWHMMIRDWTPMLQ